MRLDEDALDEVARLEGLWRGPHTDTNLLSDGVAEAWIVWRKEQALIVALCDLFTIVQQFLHIQ